MRRTWNWRPPRTLRCRSTSARRGCGRSGRSCSSRWPAANGTLSVAAKLLGISRPTLYGLMEVHGIEIASDGVADAGAAADETRLDTE